MEYSEKACCIISGRNVTQKQVERAKDALRQEVDQAMEDGYTRFLCGFGEGTDQQFAAMVAERVREDGNIRLEAAITYRNHLTRLQAQPEARRLLEACHVVHVLRESYSPKVFMERNRYLLRNSKRVIASYTGFETDGTLVTIRQAYAQNKEVREIQLI